MNRLIQIATIAAIVAVGTTAAHAEPFTYHGTLKEAGKAANGAYDLQLTLYSASTGGSIVAGPVTLYNVAVHDGAFSTHVDFGKTAQSMTSSYVDVRLKSSGSTSGFAPLENRAAAAPAGVCPASWNVDGNVGTTDANYVGTADNQPLLLKVNGQTAVSITPGGGMAVGQGTGFGGASADGAYSFSTGTLVAAGATASFAGGTAAVVTSTSPGSFIWGDSASSGSTPNSPTSADQFIVRAQGGVGINTAKGEWGGVLQDELTIAPSPGLPGSSADLTLLSSAASSTTGYKGFDISVTPGHSFGIYGLYLEAGAPQPLFYDQLLDIGYGHAPRQGFWHLNGATGANPLRVGASGDTQNGNGALLTESGVWTNASSRTFKEGFQAVDAVAILEKLVAMPVQTWFYKGNHDGLHMGPVAEDFAQVFGLGGNEKYIGTVDESGVALAAIQGLDKKLETENATLRSQIDAMQSRLDRLETRKGE
jgi:hypothetical protein